MRGSHVYNSRILAREGVRAKVVGKTPALNETRGFEIATWLSSHAPRPFVILDDDRDMDDLGDHLVQTSWDEGLTFPLADLARTHLMRAIARSRPR